MHHFKYKKSSLYAEKVPVDKLVKKFGTPLYVYSAQTLREHILKLKDALKDLDAEVCYAMKANSNLSVLSLLARQGSWFDLVSGGELYRVLKAGGKARRCTFAGVGKTRDEIEYALKKGVYCFNVESWAELELIHKVAGKLKLKAPVALRVNPDVEAGGHEKITTGTYKNKFGIAFDEIETMYAQAAQLKHIKLKGVQMHIGSQITETLPFKQAVQKMLPTVEKLRDAYQLEFFDIGGGLGIVYDPALDSGQPQWWDEGKENLPMTPKTYAEELVPLLKPLKMKIIIEPGRFVAGNAGLLLSEVLYIKKTKHKNFVIVDAAMNDLARPSMYDAYHEIVPVKRIEGELISSDVVGPVCETGDTFCQDRNLAPLKAGDHVAMLSAGAYGFVMASNYNTRPRPAEVLVDGDTFKQVRRRETWKDLIRGEYV
ncbi:MAG: diaminopimelate decarboxylase [Verrucomicrobiota bacterium]